MRRKEGAFLVTQAAITVAVLLLISLPVSRQTTLASSQSSTSTDSEFIDTTTSPCDAPGVFCGPGFTISNASLVSASTLGGNYSLLDFAVHGTYANLKITSMSIWLSNANSSQPDGANGAHLVGKVYPSWSGKDGGLYTFDVPMTGFNAIKGAQCELWIDSYSALGPNKGDNWAMQNMTIA